MIKIKDTREALDKVASMKLEESTSLDWKGRFTATPQSPEGASIWAKFVKEGWLKPYDVVWTFIPHKDGSPKEWLSIRVQIRDKNFSFTLKPKEEEEIESVFYFNLQTWRGKDALNQLSKEVSTHFKLKT